MYFLKIISPYQPMYVISQNEITSHIMQKTLFMRYRSSACRRMLMLFFLCNYLPTTAKQPRGCRKYATIHADLSRSNTLFAYEKTEFISCPKTWPYTPIISSDKKRSRHLIEYRKYPAELRSTRQKGRKTIKR